MIDNRKILASVLAPDTEKGLLKKNFRKVAGYSLIDIALGSAFASGYLDRLMVACRDDETAEHCQKTGVSIVRNLPVKHPEMTVRSNKCGLGLIEILPGFDYVVLLDASSPLRLASDIDSAIELCHRNQGRPVVTVSDTALSLRDLHYINSDRGMLPVFPRPEADAGTGAESEAECVFGERKIYEVNYSVLVASTEYLKAAGTFFCGESLAYLVPKERSIRVESKTDLAIAESLIEKCRIDISHTRINGGFKSGYGTTRKVI